MMTHYDSFNLKNVKCVNKYYVFRDSKMESIIFLDLNCFI
jgi:hypothetical protein